VSTLACGTHIKPFSQEECDVFFNCALDRGINVIVTSAAYLTVEAKISRAVGHRRDEFVIATTTDYRDALEVGKEVDRSLGIFNTDHIDIYQIGAIHRRPEDLDRVLKPDGALRALQRAKKAGKIDHIGVTGHRSDVVAKAIATDQFDTALFIFNWAQKDALADLIPLAKKHDVGLMAIRPLQGGAFVDQVRNALRFVLCSPVDVAVTGMYTPAEIDANVQIAEPPCTSVEWATLLAEAESLDGSGCQRCDYCMGIHDERPSWLSLNRETVCPQGIPISTLLSLHCYRARFGLPRRDEQRWREAIERAKTCDDCMRCEASCPYSLPIARLVHAAVQCTAG
jgi:predicted aldo/keto reductase-like oxidoreductase